PAANGAPARGRPVLFSLNLSLAACGFGVCDPRCPAGTMLVLSRSKRLYPKAAAAAALLASARRSGSADVPSLLATLVDKVGDYQISSWAAAGLSEGRRFLWPRRRFWPRRCRL